MNKTSTKIWKVLMLTMVSMALASALVTHSLPAGLYHQNTTTSILIDGIDFGEFSSIDGLEQFTDEGALRDGAYGEITFHRDFVADPSLYQWAKRLRSKKYDRKNMHLVTRDESGSVVSHKVLNLCQPLSWSVETANPSMGGFHETVKIAAQKVSSK